MLPISTDQVLAELQHHRGRAHGVHVRDLVQRITGQLGTTDHLERVVRKVVKQLRLAGEPICAHPSDGYFMAETAEELEHTCNFLHARAVSSLQAESQLRKISVADLLSRYTLPKYIQATQSPIESKTI
jgi:FlaA1/EpsC-like NDP-sugar epimerase